jgi:tripartite-type tricarboxylate transporter receptor subunit TctC
LFILAMLHASVGGAFAQGYPVKPIRIVVPFTPGGSADILARAIGQKMSESLGQSIVIDNRPGSGGVIGSEVAARAPADGYTLMMGIAANIAINPALYPKLPYDPVRDFAPVTLVASAPYVLVVPPALPAKTVKDLIGLAKARPGQLAYASLGSGSVPHLTGALFATMSGIKLLHVPYKNIGQAMTDLISGQVQMLFLGMVSAQPHVKAGKLRAVAITGVKRSSMMAHAPTVAESGVRGFEVTGWYGVFVPAGTPKEIISRLHKEIVRVLGLPEVRERLSAEGADLVGNTPEEFEAYIKTEIAKWAKAVKLSGASAE